MNELIKIATDAQGERVVSARELHGFLGTRSKFADWIKNRIRKYQFREAEDYVAVSKNLETGGWEHDYALTLDMAKQLAMVENNPKGQQARLYFINCEKALRLISQQIVPTDQRRIDALEQKLDQVLAIQQQAASALLALPRSPESVPEETTRTQVQRIVNAYCRVKNLSQQDVWRLVYDRLYYAYRVSIRRYKKRSERESWLDVAERQGHMDKIFAIVSKELISAE